ncbi:hypothetical protein M413DRAFT_49101, partial [Hebeloma cylindrosporum]
NAFPVGAHVVLRRTDGTTLSLEIVRPFLPFTKCLVYVVRPESSSVSDSLPPEVILKIYDPRYIDERIQSKKYGSSRVRTHVWTLEAEMEAVRYRQEIAEGKRPDDFTVHLLYKDGDAHPFLWEEDFYRYLKESSENEVAAFGRLRSLQGTVIPKFYGSGNVIPPPGTRAIEPPAVLLEYISGSMTLADYHNGHGVSERPNVIPSTIFRPLVDAVRRFKELGVYHGDISGKTILVSSAPSSSQANPEGGTLTRAVLINFGRAGVREDRESEEDWE